MSLELGLTAGCICRLAMFRFSSLQCLICTDGLPHVELMLVCFAAYYMLQYKFIQ